MALLLLFISFPTPVYAAETSTNVWIRAQISYESGDGLCGLSDDMVTLASDRWIKREGYYYYSSPVQSGQSIDLIRSVQIPASWDNTNSGKRFSIVIKVEAAEAFPGDAGWTDGTAAVYSQSFELSKQNAERNGLTVQQGNIRVRIEEFQEIDGREQPYENNRTVVPGETVSKIVRITVEGNKSVLSPIEEILRSPVKTGDDGKAMLYLAAAAGLVVIVICIIAGGKGGGHGGRTRAAA